MWHTQDETPSEAGPVTALIALPGDGDEGEAYLLGIVMWRDGQWLDEDTAEPAVTRHPRFWWCLEADLLRGLA